MVDQSILNKWLNEYINNINIENRKYLLLSGKELNIFVVNNYYDNNLKRIVTGENFYMPIGLQYLDYSSFNEEAYGGTVKFLISYAPNNIGKNTILSEMRYYENCNQIARNQVKKITYIEYAEVNKYFRSIGLYKELVKEFSKVVNKNNPLLTTNQSVNGYKCHVLDILKSTLIENGFKQDIRDEYAIDHEYYDFLREKEKTLSRNI